jgi:hypothetical protein
VQYFCYIVCVEMGTDYSVSIADSLYSINVCCFRHYPLSDVGVCLIYATIRELDLIPSLGD